MKKLIQKQRYKINHMLKFDIKQNEIATKLIFRMVSSIVKLCEVAVII